MHRLKLQPIIKTLTLNEIKDIEVLINQNINPKKKKQLEAFNKILTFNKEIIINPSIDSISSQDKLNTIKSIYVYKTEMKSLIEKYQTDMIFNLFFEKNSFQIKKEIKFKLFDLYEYFLNNFLDNIKEEATSITSIKYYDFYHNKTAQEKTIDKLVNNEIDNQKLFFWLKNKISNAKNIEILTSLSTNKIYDFYKKNILRCNPNINIKYKPLLNRQTTSSMAYLLLTYTYGNKKNGNTKKLIMYLEENTNWAVVSNVSTSDFTDTFYYLLDTRFDHYFKKDNVINFDPPSTNKSDLEFQKEIDIICNNMDIFIDSDNTKELEKDIRKKINRLKILFPNINYGHRLLRTTLSYLVVLKQLLHKKKNNDKIKNTEYIVHKILDSKLYSRSDDILKSIENYNSKDTLKLRMGIILPINGKTALCDLYPDDDFKTPYNILRSLEDITNNTKKLSKFFRLFSKNSDSVLNNKDMKRIFKEKVIPKVTNGEEIKKNYIFKGETIDFTSW